MANFLRVQGAWARSPHWRPIAQALKRAGFSAALAVGTLLCVRPAAAQITTVSVTGGQVQGVSADGITSFKGIPFAAPPVGERRWREPQPVAPWSGMKQADRFAPGCLQDPALSRMAGASIHRADSEDCLYLNVWTPVRSVGEKLPVMVWIYGGGLAVGMTSLAKFDGAHLARKGVVLVSVAYRLGALGFMADPRLSAESPHHVSGNYGLLDVIAALQWVRANIGRFGGDPSRVTIFGVSAGGSITARLATSPLGKGLFQRVISESGDIGGGGQADPSDLDLPAAEAMGKRFLAQLGAHDIAAARRLPARTLVEAQGHVGRFLDVRDGYVRPDGEYERFAAGRFSDTPLLLGSNADEGRMLLPFVLPNATPARLEAQVRAHYGPDADAVLALYPHVTDAEAKQAAADMVRDSDMGWNAWAWALLYAQHGSHRVYLYYFDRRSPQAPRGPTHGDEVSYVFGNWVNDNDAPSPPDGAQPSDLELSDRIQGYWVNFAKTGNPNGAGLPPWPAFTASSQQVLYLDDQSHAGPVPNLRQISAIETHYAKARYEAAQKRRVQ